MSITQEKFTNPLPSTTVSSGGTTAPAQNTVESWTMAGSYGSWPTISNAASPPQIMRICDPAPGYQAEIMWVTNISGATWTVTRGAEGTATIAHSANFAIQELVTGATFNNFLQAIGTTTDQTVADYQPDGVAAAGGTYKAADAGHTHPFNCAAMGTSAPYNTAIANTETLIVRLPIKPANIRVGSTFLVILAGTVTNTTTGTTTFFTIRAGTAGTTADQSVATFSWATQTTATTNAPCIFYALFTVTSVGSTGNINGVMALILGPASWGTTAGSVSHIPTATTGWNTSTATYLDVTFISGGSTTNFTPLSAVITQIA
jgi:hypothetical protein